MFCIWGQTPLRAEERELAKFSTYVEQIRVDKDMYFIEKTKKESRNSES